MGVKEDPVNTKIRCQSYMNACSSHVPEEEQSTSSRLSCSDNFETAILGCTADDQKKIKKRLQGLLDYFARINITST